MRVFLADDHMSLRNSLKFLFERESDIEFVGEAEQVDGLLARIKSACPDIVVLDWELPGQPSASLLGAIHAFAFQPKIMAWSVWPEEEEIASAAGADCFFCKGDSGERLLHTMRTVHSYTPS